MRLNKLLSIFAGAGLVMSVQAGTFVPNRVLIKTNSALPKVIQTLSSSHLNSGVVNHLSRLTQDVSVLRFSTGVSAKQAAAEISELPGIEWAQPDYLYRISDVEGAKKIPTLTLPKIFADGPFFNDPMLTADTMWGLYAISAPEAWKLNTGNTSVIVADIDTGVDYKHEDLKENIWTNPDSTAADQHGYDFANKDADPMDDHMHGTHTSGTIGARGNNGKGVSGVSPQVSIIPIKFISVEGSGTSSDAILSIDYAIAKGARVMSNSWGGPAEGNESDLALKESIERAAAKDILFVAAAGNDGADNDVKPMFPAAYPVANILTVASSNSSDRLSFFSNYGKTTVHVAAPGSNIVSTVPGNKYDKTSGTSMACPHVAGLAALLLSVNPALTALQLKSIIMETVDPIPAMSGKIVSGGRVNALKAVMRAKEIGF